MLRERYFWNIIFGIGTFVSAFCIGYFFMLPWMHAYIVDMVETCNIKILKTCISFCIILISMIIGGFTIFNIENKKSDPDYYSLKSFFILFFLKGFNISAFVFYFSFYFYSLSISIFLIYILTLFLRDKNLSPNSAEKIAHHAIQDSVSSDLDVTITRSDDGRITSVDYPSPKKGASK